MTSLTIGQDGKVEIPHDLRSRYRLTPETPIRIIETPGAILLVPVTDAPMTPELCRELEEWQALSRQTWDLFPYDAEESEP